MFYHYQINPELPVHKEIPAAGIEVDFDGDFKDMDWQAVISQPTLYTEMCAKDKYYYCPNSECQGYIKGTPAVSTENSIGAMAGRCGTSYHCIRCGWELYFNGYIS